MSFPTLFTTSSKVGTRYWKIDVVEETTGVYLLKEYGKYGGKAIINKKQIIVAKSQTSVLSQALFEAQGSWDEMKTKKGYVEDIGKTTNISSQLGCSAPADLVGVGVGEKGKDEVASPKKFLPMLANQWKERKSYLKFPCIGQPKLDGVRHMAHVDDQGQIEIRTRTDTICPFFHEIKQALSQIGLATGVYLDGEFYSQTLPFRTLNGYCNRKKLEGKSGYTSIPRQHLDSIKYHIFDCYFINEPTKPFAERYQYLTEILKNTLSPFLMLVKNYEITGEDQIKNRHDQFVEEGYEGLILRNINSPYKLKARSNDLLKYKSFLDSEFEITGAISPETGKEAGCIIWTLKIPTSGATFTCRPRDTYVSRQEDWSQYQRTPTKYIGQMYTVRYQETYENGIPRFPVGVALRCGEE
jgi:DNA ligase-1